MLARCFYGAWLLVALVACSSQPFSTRSQQEPLIEAEKVGDAQMGNEVFSELDSLLVYRERACRLPAKQRDDLLRGYQELDSPMAIMATLMLASCAPDKTPGLLANSVVLARQLEHRTPGFNALLSLLEAQLRSYSVLESELQRTQKRLEEMIEGLREIEAEMGRETRVRGR